MSRRMSITEGSLQALESHAGQKRKAGDAATATQPGPSVFDRLFQSSKSRQPTGPSTSAAPVHLDSFSFQPPKPKVNGRPLLPLYYTHLGLLPPFPVLLLIFQDNLSAFAMQSQARRMSEVHLSAADARAALLGTPGGSSAMESTPGPRPPIPLFNARPSPSHAAPEASSLIQEIGRYQKLVEGLNGRLAEKENTVRPKSGSFPVV